VYRIGCLDQLSFFSPIVPCVWRWLQTVTGLLTFTPRSTGTATKDLNRNRNINSRTDDNTKITVTETNLSTSVNIKKHEAYYEAQIMNNDNVREVFYLFIVLYNRVFDVLEEKELTSFLKRVCFGLIWNEREREKARERHIASNRILFEHNTDDQTHNRAHLCVSHSQL